MSWTVMKFGGSSLANPERVAQVAALVAALGACARIEAETSLGVTFDAGDIEVGVNDRHLAPNTEATEQVLRPLIEQALKALVPDAAFTIVRSAGAERGMIRIVAGPERKRTRQRAARGGGLEVVVM